MTRIPQSVIDDLENKKQKVENWQTYFKGNIDRYNDFINLVFNTALTPETINKLKDLNKPPIEFNVLEAFVSQERAQFNMQVPNINVRPSDTTPIERMTDRYMAQIDVIGGYLRYIFNGAGTDGVQSKFYTDILAGGWSVGKVFTDYANDYSFEQEIRVDRVYDPTMAGFDPTAQKSHKGDGEYCFCLYPKTEQEFIDEYGKTAVENMSFARNEGAFNWSYSIGTQKIALVCEMYEKKNKRKKLVKLANGHTVLEEHYKDLLEEWERRGYIEQPPVVVNSRWTNMQVITRTDFCGGAILDYYETNYDMLPLVFIDGNSVSMLDGTAGITKQMTRPSVYHAKGIQLLKNASGQALAAEIENTVAHKFMAAVEGIPDGQYEAYMDVQHQDVILYHAFLDKDPNVPLPPPVSVDRVAPPAIIENTFLGTDRVTEIILGSYTTTLATNEKNVSGKAIANGSIVSSAHASPYLEGYIRGLNRLAEVVTSLIPKYYLTPRSLPILTYDGKRAYKIINTPGIDDSIWIGFRPNELNIEVEAGVNNNIQKAQALELITRLMGASELFAEFINTMGLEILVENLDIKGADSLKVMAAQFMELRNQQMQEQADQPTPEEQMMNQVNEVEMAKVDQRAQQAEGELAIQASKVALEKQKIDAEVAEIINKIENENAKMALEQERIDSENARSAIEAAIDLTKSRNNE